MTLAETTVSNAIRYSMRRFCFANIIIAGPICAGKKSLAQLIADCSDVYSVEPNVTIFYQDDYYKEYSELEDTPFGVKNIDAKSAFDTKRFVRDVRTFYEFGHVGVSAYSRTKWIQNWVNEQEETKTACILKVKKARRTNIFVGPHAIELLTPSVQTTELLNDGNLPKMDAPIESYVVPYKIPEVICIYLNTAHDICMERREKSKLMFPENLVDAKLYREYERFIEKQTEEEIAFQKDMADLVVNCN